ncbi:MAG: hypothetical protein JRG75_12820 [Deltaproteobacteria bacterium]|nr:hypothetical protein [Deltaproteobacteria bacterium]
MKKIFLMSLVGFFLVCGIAYSEGTDVQSGEAATDESIQTTAPASGEEVMAPEGFSEPEQEPGSQASEEIDEQAPAEQGDVVPPATPEEAP